MIKPENVYISPKSYISTEYFSGDYKDDDNVHNFNIMVEDGVPTKINWTKTYPKNIADVENLIRIKFNNR